MTAALVRFDAELVVHRAAEPMPCAGAVVSREKPWPQANPHLGTILVVRRCTLPVGHRGDHDAAAAQRRPHVTACGINLGHDAWIAWTLRDNDPLCAGCHGLPADEQGSLL